VLASAAPALFSAFVWWFSTGIVLYLDGLPQNTFRWSVLGSTVLMGVGFAGLYNVADDQTAAGAYAGFFYAMLIWGWLELSYYTGYVTGPRKIACAPGCAGWRHFGHALESSLYHEAAIVIAILIALALTWDQPNRVGLWTLLLVFGMHESARLNVFLGVRNLNADWLPPHLNYLRGFLRKRAMNPLFPVSITIGTTVTVLLVRASAANETGSFEAVSMALLATLAGLAMFEHWLMILPLPTNWMWRWGLGNRALADIAGQSISPPSSQSVPPPSIEARVVGHSV
jgi:putative photosynthetic complex assembly protein 2